MRIRFRESVAVPVLLIILALTAATLSCVYTVSTRVADRNASDLFNAVAKGAYERIDNQIGRTLSLAGQGASLANLHLVDGDVRGSPAFNFMTTALRETPSLYSIYYGLDDGSFYQVIASRNDPVILAAHKAPAGTAWILRSIAGQGKTRTQKWMFLDSSWNELSGFSESEPAFNPGTRPWYRTAVAGKGDSELSPAYIFDSLGRPGITASRWFPGGVFGVDITLTGLEEFVRDQYISKDGGLILFDREQHVLAMTNLPAPRHEGLVKLGEIDSPLVHAIAGRAAHDHSTNGLVRIEDGELSLMFLLAEWGPVANKSIGIAIVSPSADFLLPMVNMQKDILLVTLALTLAFLCIGYYFARGLAASVTGLSNDAMAVRHLDFSGPDAKPSLIAEFDDLGQAFALMKSALSARTRSLEETQAKLARLVELGIAMSSERNSERLTELILTGATELTGADGGTVYIRGKDELMHFRLLSNRSLGLAPQAGSDDSPVMPPVPLFDPDGRPNHHNVVSHAVHLRKTVLITDAYDTEAFDFSGTREFDQRTGYRSQSFLTIPLMPRGGDVIGALQLINAISPETGEVIPFPATIQRFIEAMAAQASTALYNNDLVQLQDQLVESIIHMVAGAIDAKSPHTSTHCERVPELALMLAEEASEQTSGPLAPFQFTTEQEWREFRIGAWMHDCGKMVTPEHIIDKATKLETIYNRIHEVRTRYEVLLRDADIRCLEAIAAGRPEAEARAECEAEKARLIDDFAFIAECNIGTEKLAPESVARLAEIAKTTWVRHLDDRLGLGQGELKRLADIPATPLPATETILTDKPWQIFKREEAMRSVYDGLNFSIDIPADLYNLGELYNLTIPSGTLTREDRFKVNEHVMQTIAMLKRLSFPDHLKRVPEYAGTHHETLNGTGYPYRLKADQLSVPARIMAIADIFEALTAIDRPYKVGKTLSESVRILHQFKQRGLIDPDLFDLFLSSGIYLRYAHRYLREDQIDEIDVGEFLS